MMKTHPSLPPLCPADEPRHRRMAMTETLALSMVTLTGFASALAVTVSGFLVALSLNG